MKIKKIRQDLKCPYCDHKSLVESGRAAGKGYLPHRRYRCTYKPCARVTIHPVRV